MSLLLLTLAVATAAVQPVTPPAPATTAAAAADDDRLICRREGETGSLVKKRRVCYTAAQWRKRAEDNQNFTADLQDKLRNNPGGQ